MSQQRHADAFERTMAIARPLRFRPICHTDAETAQNRNRLTGRGPENSCRGGDPSPSSHLEGGKHFGLCWLGNRALDERSGAIPSGEEKPQARIRGIVPLLETIEGSSPEHGR